MGKILGHGGDCGQIKKRKKETQMLAGSAGMCPVNKSMHVYRMSPSKNLEENPVVLRNPGLRGQCCPGGH